MSGAANGAPQPAGPSAKPAPARKKPGFANLLGSPEAKRLACLMLEVLSGYRSTTSACSVAGIAPQRFYVLEARALQAMVFAVEPMKKGPKHRPENVQKRLFERGERLERELRRTQALLRSAQRAIGLSPPKETEVVRKDKKGKEKRHKRRPGIRAKQVIDALRASIPPEGSATEVTPADTNGSGPSA